jgi:uncharacterized BrkB/YihY/UPF0761 family membrane protein
MLFVFTALISIVLFGTTAAAYLDRFTAALPFPAQAQVVIVTGISLASAFLLFSALYSVFPNIGAGYKLRNVWMGAAPAAILFQLVSTIWPIYVRVSHASRYSAVIFSLIVLTAWLYAYSIILLFGAEVIAVASMRKRRDAALGRDSSEAARKSSRQVGSERGRSYSDESPARAARGDASSDGLAASKAARKR